MEVGHEGEVGVEHERKVEVGHEGEVRAPKRLKIVHANYFQIFHQTSAHTCALVLFSTKLISLLWA